MEDILTILTSAIVSDIILHDCCFMSQKRQKRINDLPATGTPNSTQEKKDLTGKIIQRRYYGADGRATLNIDYGHDHNGAGDPHAHDWDWNLPSPRQPARSLFTGELEIYES